MLTRVLPAQLLFLTLLLGMIGCGPKQPDFPELVPVKGVVKKGKETVKGGAVQFEPESAQPAFLIASPVEPDGSFTLSTTRTTDKAGESRAGAPAGKYKVTYTPSLADRVPPPEKGSKKAHIPGPINITAPVTVSAGQADLTIDLTKGVDITLKASDKKGDAKGGFNKKGDTKKK